MRGILSLRLSGKTKSQSGRRPEPTKVGNYNLGLPKVLGKDQVVSAKRALKKIDWTGEKK